MKRATALLISILSVLAAGAAALGQVASGSQLTPRPAVTAPPPIYMDSTFDLNTRVLTGSIGTSRASCQPTRVIVLEHRREGEEVARLTTDEEGGFEWTAPSSVVGWIRANVEESEDDGGEACAGLEGDTHFIPLAEDDGGQLDPRFDPQTEGPLDYDYAECGGGGRFVSNEIVVRIVSCTRFYLIDPAADDDSDSDHGIIWEQFSASPKNGRCIRQVALKVDPRPDLDRSFPSDELRTRSTRGVVTYYEDEDLATSVSQGWVLRRNSASPTLDNGNFRLTWKGPLTRRIVSFAAGFAVSWPEGDPPQSWELHEHHPDEDPWDLRFARC